MSTEKVETNGTQESDNAATSSAKKSTKGTATKEKEKEVVALSVSQGSSAGTNLIKHTDTLPGGRPIEASHLKVVSTYNSVGAARPVVASGMEIKGTLTISGDRPIAASHLVISETYTVMGNRPVASNEIDDPASLMGFLD
ncbi:hypothetical protein [Gloeothece verrucosa]|uniref:Uncharacterized protein n=1 Tax=Gloeothece verrucosa (strain PCC 7822) TaxID=497965 RepID=E0UBS8_GLOV7|nr:hypothetical protein [Gloeothece verrucosa]ADN15143.1 conserved hypothetical protein [Gloeothece verrucosa PCC 7822]